MTAQSKRRLRAVFVLLALLPACNGGEVQSLRDQVAQLHSQVSKLQDETESLRAQLAKSQRVAGCLDEVRGLVDDLGRASKYLSSDKVFGPATSPYYATLCKGVLSTPAIRDLKESVAESNRAVDHAGAARIAEVFSLPTTSGSGGGSATAICNDGTYSYSQHASGTCSWHGGVREWINYPGN